MTRSGRLATAAGVGAVLVGCLTIRAGTDAPIEALRAARNWFLSRPESIPVDAKPKPDQGQRKRKPAPRVANKPQVARRAEVPMKRKPLPKPTAAADPMPGNARAPRRIASTPAPGPPLVPAPLLPHRAISYLPGQLSEWVVSDFALDGPRIIRAAGRISVNGELSDPNGLHDSTYERSLPRRSKTGWNERALPSAPYLSLIGRVCSAQICSQPFFVGTSAVVCPSDTVAGPVGLQLWTNNYVRVDGVRTTRRYGDVAGGFSVYAETAAPDACADRSASRAVSHDLTPMVSGEVLRGPALRVSSNQSWWKPFSVPLGQPLLIRASGEVQPRTGVSATGPEGIAVPEASQWAYPGTSDVVVGAGHKLYNRALPYQALIGRLCGTDECGSAFLVGTERTICAKSPLDDHLELWINHIVGADGRLKAIPLAMDTFELLEGRRGEYRFEVSRAPAGACGSD
jgi:hypothetical protein